ncbi:pilus assembly protein PilP [Legionella clemsonensis]|uniref:Pilus assembly protein, PilP n=1 Tax=Legionella clemsonensis TaxID=1867846 RepID=A0A222P0W3_9GAMM|nr:pilus assembly protein PilP [Legionella clemsonensis]ASQ45466.1 Pilus assembly protein, PilP [Legionella clemsonensis]
MIFKKRITLIILILMVTSCSETDKELTQYFQKIKNRKVPFHEDTPLLKLLAKFDYPLGNKRNPFLYNFEDNKKVEESSSRPLLKEFFFNSLQFVGLLCSSEKSWILIKNPAGKITAIKPGDHIARENIELIKIKKKELLFRAQNFVEGKWQQQTVKVSLKNKNRS